MANSEGISDLARRARSFGVAAAAYAEHRPSYPPAAVEWAAEQAPADRPLRLVEVGAGTGKLTQVLVNTLSDRTESVIATEPDERMLAELGRQLPSVEAKPGSAERIPVQDDSVDLVFAAQAVHWFDMDRALPEFARVLRPDGSFVVLFNTDDDRVPWVNGLCDLVGQLNRATQDMTPPNWANSPLFAGYEVTTFEHTHRYTAESLVEMIGTTSQYLIMAADERKRELDKIRTYLAGRPETARGEFDMPMVTVGMRMPLASP